MLSAARAGEPEGAAEPRAERLSLAVLAAGAAVVLAAGGAWWVASDPERRVRPAMAIAPAVVPEQRAEPEVPQQNLESFLPELPDTVLRETGRINPEVTYSLPVGTVKDGAYTLQYVCLGPGSLSVRIRSTTHGEQLYEVDCGGNISAYDFEATGSTTVIEVHRPSSEPADIAIQVVKTD